MATINLLTPAILAIPDWGLAVLMAAFVVSVLVYALLGGDPV